MNKVLAFLFFGWSMSGCAVKESKITVQMMPSPADSKCAEPYLFTDGNSTTFLSWIEKRDTISFLKYAKLVGDAWSEPLTIDSGSNVVASWADYPVMACDGNHFMANVLQETNEETESYDVKLLSSMNGSSWNNAGLLNHDSVQAEHGFVSLVPFQDKVFAAWLDGRNTGGGHDHHDHGGHQGAMTVRGAILGYDGKKIEEWELDNRVCDCCQTTAVITNNGPVVIYRDRSDEEIRDMSIVRLVNGTWTTPKPIYNDNWKIDGCPVNGPRCDALGNTLAVAWFSAENGQGEVKVIFSNNGGETFLNPTRIDEGNTKGRVDLVMLDEHFAMVSWMEGPDIQVAIVSNDGVKDKIIVANSSEARSSGFPQLAKSGNRIIMAWTDDETKSIKVAELKTH
jgi:hypothetical protein